MCGRPNLITNPFRFFHKRARNTAMLHGARVDETPSARSLIAMHEIFYYTLFISVISTVFFASHLNTRS